MIILEHVYSICSVKELKIINFKLVYFIDIKVLKL